MLLEVDLRDRRPADVARLGELPVHAVRLLVVRAAFAQLEAAGELGVDRLGEPGDLLAVEILRQRVRREPGVVEDLVRPRPPDPGDHALVAEQRVEPARLARADLRQPLGADPVGLRPEVRELVLGLFRRQQPDARPLLRPRLGENEQRPALELEPERRRLRSLLARPEELEAPCRHEVEKDDELAVLGRHQEPLRAPLDAFELPALQRSQRRVVGLQRRDVRGPRLLDRESRHGVVQLAAPGLHLGILRHA